ncbi:MAG: hypothetical protein JW995_09520 [Melioribacteraceae bacterium]|nr:hypothetical protein [Melioribacteraceae bacterium]
MSRNSSLRFAKREIKGKIVTLKIKYNDFTTRTRSKSVEHYICKYEEVFPIVNELVFKPGEPDRPVRLLGVGLSNLNIPEPDKDREQLTLEI